MRWVYFCILGAVTWAAAADRPPIFPEPQKVTVRQDGFPVDEQVPVVVPESATAADVALARQLIAELSDRYGVPLRMGAAGVLPRGRFILMGAASNPLVRQYLAANHSAPPARDEAISCAPDRMRLWWPAMMTRAPSMASSRSGSSS